MTRPLLALCLILLVLSQLSAVACGGADGPSARRATGSLTLFDIAPPTLDPALARSSTSLTYIAEIFSGLVAFDPDLNLKPEIARSWDLSADGTTYTFHLREGVVFHNGRKLTAHDFKYSIERAADPSTGSMTAGAFLSDIVGVQERLSGDAMEVEGVEVIDDLTLRITVDAPKEYFLFKLAHPVAYVVDRANVEARVNWWQSPNGSGAFSLQRWEPDELIELQRNDDYYLDPPRLERVTFLLWAGVPIRMYDQGQIDVSGVGLGDIERVLDPANPLHDELYVTPELSLSYIGFNTSKPPFDDPKVRQAFTLAVDREKLLRLVLKDLVEPAVGVLPPGMPGYSESIQGLAFDVDEATRLLAESSYGVASALPPITLTSSGRGTASSVEAALVDMWRRNLGVEVVIRQLEPGRFPFLLMQEKDELFTMGWAADYPDPQNFLEMLFQTGSPDNFGEYSNPQLDDLLDRARVQRDPASRLLLYGEAEQLLVSDAACLPLYFHVSYTLVKPYVKDLPLTPLWIPRLRYVSVDSP